MFEDEYDMEDLWDDAEEFERNCLAEDQEWTEEDEEDEQGDDWEPEPMEDQWLDGSYEE